MLGTLGIISALSIWELTKFAMSTPMISTSLPGLDFKFCQVAAIPDGKSWIYWGQLLLFETLLFSMIDGNIDQGLNVVLSCDLRGLFSLFDHGANPEFPTGFATAVSGIMTQRLVLNLRSNYSRTCEFGTQHSFRMSTWRAADDSLHDLDHTQDIQFSPPECDSEASSEGLFVDDSKNGPVSRVP
ncbi:uncharacterized protein FOMMEDRAFT_157007 [Fomitiporia mediterranea MF3/22]|uniref:uncharacterized protein n=1 Tax=Fomitiporia mediterranea (strain MF3/22) TaxID=694068 RepID=UPI000440986C|nr:uncharacterized protein FOMMEDRAFT_157007 [Fomitiporia mediterranea MF3/22]EJD01877.1 hypothetical protein FOMMEDRAFT_157007 [Fomitiporia mediterranea MF3/22]